MAAAGRNHALGTARRAVAAPRASASPEGSPETAPLPRPASSSTLAEETSALDAARSSLRAGRATETIALLDSCARRFPNGLLQPEASALRIEALLALGDRAGAETVARALVTTAPNTFAAHRAGAMLNW